MNDNGYTYFEENKGAVAKRRVLLLAPFAFFVAGVFLICSYALDTFVFGSAYWGAFFAENADVDYNDTDYIGKVKEERPVAPQKVTEDEDITVAPPVIVPDSGHGEEGPFSYLEELPPLEDNAYIYGSAVGGFSLGQFWASLSVHGDELLSEVPVYQGDSSYLLSKGIGHLYGSTFPGEGGVCVLAAHVSGKAGFFGNIAEESLYTVGTQIKLDTAYGVYVYEVVDTDIRNYKDEYYVKKYNNKFENNYEKLAEAYGADELLVMYTCYPAGTAFREQRFYLICRRIYGYSWR